MAQLKKRMIIDTETSLYDVDKGLYGSNCLVYDLGYVITDKYGNIYEKGSYVIEEIFCNTEIMQRAYFFNKMPNYIKDIAKGKRVLEKWDNVRNIIIDTMNEYDITEVWAFNAMFDNGAINRTNKVINGEWEYFPIGTTINCILRFAECNLIKQKSYTRFCERNELKTATGKLSKTAENIYRYLIDNAEYIEEHTAFEDAMIESEILNRCLRQHKKKKPSIVVNIIGE